MIIYVLHKETKYTYGYGPSLFLGVYSNLELAQAANARYIAGRPDWDPDMCISEMDLDKDVLEGYL